MQLGHHSLGHGGKKVFVLHGWFSDHTGWNAVFPFLDTEGFTYVFPDYRGYGLSKELAGAHSIEEASSDVLALADTLGWQSFAVVGHSMGGSIAQRVAVDGGARVTKLIGVTPIPATGSPLPPELDQLFSDAADNDSAARSIIGASLGLRLTPKTTETILNHSRQASNFAAFRDFGQAFRKTDFGALASEKIRIPFLVLYGQHDLGVSEAFVRASFPALYPNVEIRELPNAGHYPMLETPLYLVHLIEGFLAAD